MADLTTAFVGVGGTLLGAGATFVFGRLNAARLERNERWLRLRAERMEVYSAFAGAVVAYRRGQIQAWRRRTGVSVTEPESDRFALRNAAVHGRYRVLLVADSAELEELATRAVDLAGDIYAADDEKAMAAARNGTYEAIELFVRTAHRQLGTA